MLPVLIPTILLPRLLRATETWLAPPKTAEGDSTG
jgi:hypothetical protein